MTQQFCTPSEVFGVTIYLWDSEDGNLLVLMSFLGTISTVSMIGWGDSFGMATQRCLCFFGDHIAPTGALLMVLL